MKPALRTDFFFTAAARTICRTAHQSRQTHPQALFYHQFIHTGLLSRCRLGVVCLVILLASMGAQAQNTTVTICAGSAINLNSTVSPPVGSTLSFSIKPPAKAIAAGDLHGLALLVDGTVVGWGFNDFGQLNVPASATPAKAIAAGYTNSLALRADGKVVAWGDISQLPVPASATPATAIAAGTGSQHSLALKADGTVVAWGNNQYGQTDVPASAMPATALAASSQLSLALKADGTVVAWGRNLYGQLSVPASATPATAIAAGSFYGLALKANGSVVGWGDNVYGQLSVPASAAPAIAIAAGSQHSLALKANGTVVAWGYNNHGQTTVPASAIPATAIAAGRDYSLAVKANGSVVGWGDNSTGQTAGYDAQPLTSPVVSPTATQTYYYIVRSSSGSPTYGTVTVAVNTGPPPTRLYVRANATGAGNGLSWADAFPDLQQALSQSYRCAQNLTEIWVAAGTYKPTATTDRAISFTLQDGVAIYGGFAGNETSLSQRPTINPVAGQPSGSTLSGDIGAVGNAADNTYHVINNAPGLTSTAVLDGFVITGGNISENQAFGGGMLHTEGSPTITNCSFQGNSAAYGGAVYITSGSPRLTNCSFQGNSAAYGGAIANFSSAVLINCSFQGNTATALGGAVYNANNSDARMINCSFQGNSAVTRGGAVYNSNSNLTMSNCVLWNNGGTLAFYDATGGVSVSYCLLEAGVGGYTNGGNNQTATTSPFVSANAVALNACAPAINLGSNANYQAANGPATDLAGNPRIYNGVIDMGAVEYQAAPAVNISPPSVNTATAGAPFSQSFVASGGSGPYSYALFSGSLPTGLSLATTGVLSGTPTQGGSFTLTVRGQDATGCSGVSAPYILLVQLDSPIRYVKAGAAGSGSSWADASGDLQSQINLVGAQQVWVATGTYKPGPPNNTNRSISFAMRPNVAIYGGFAGTETDLNQRVLGNPLATILSGDIGTAGSNTDNSYHVVNNATGLTNSAVLDGFLITSGNANGSSSPDDSGGGMINNGNGAGNTCSPLIRNCLFIYNRAANQGGALYNAGYTSGTSNPTLINCAFQSNYSANRGGAIYNDGSVGGNSNPSLINCSFQGNSAASGGAMGNISYQGSSRPVLTNCVVWGNGGASTFNNQQGAFITTSYSLFESSVTGYSPGTGNLTTTTTPFVSTTDTRLTACSPAIDAGDKAANGTSTDLAGNPRTFNGGPIDMGAYEYQGPPGLIITAPGVSTARVGVAFNQSFSASGGTSPYNYSLASGNVPTGLSLSNTGVLSGTPTQAGSYTLTVLGRDATGCSGMSAPYALTVTDAPGPNPTLTGLTANPGAVCVGSVATFTATVGNVTGSYGYTLTNGLGSSLTGNASGPLFSQSIPAAGTGTQTFTLTVSANGQSASGVTSLTVNPVPVASLTNNGPLTCAQTSVTLTASGGSSYTFANGNGVLGTPGASNTLVVNSPGTYSVTVASANGCVSSTSTPVNSATTVIAATLTASPSTTLSCAQTSLTLTAGGGNSYAFSPNVMSQTGNTALVNASGTYSVTVTNTNTGCFSVTSITISQDNTVPQASLTSSGMITCAMSSVTLTASPNGLSYAFAGPGVVSQNGNQAIVNTTGTYSVTVSNGATGCSATAQTTVTGDQSVPTASLTNNGPITCSMSSVTLTASGGHQLPLQQRGQPDRVK